LIKKGGLVKNADRRFWGSLAVMAIIGACVIIGLRIAMDVVIIDNNLKKEELKLLRETVDQLSEVKSMISQLYSNPARPGANDKRMPTSPGADDKRMPSTPGIKKVEGVTAGTNTIKGEVNAPVLMVEFSDFECPFSKRFYKETFPKIEKEYISTGKVKFAYRDYILPFHPLAQPSAIASRCAGKKNKFWEIFDKLSNSEKLDQDVISMSAKAVGLDKDEFSKCMNDPSLKKEVKNDMEEAVKFGVSGTPAFFINGRMVVGAVPFEAFKQIIDEELNKTKNK
jgi:protein-disulfide isomerase